MSEQEHNGLTLEGLAQRLEVLERENERTRSENVVLRDEVSALRGSGTLGGEMAVLRGSDTSRTSEAASEFAGRVSRRSLLSKAGAAAVAAVAAGTLLGTRQAKASHYATGLIEADIMRTHFIEANSATGGGAMSAWTASNTSPALDATNNGSKPAVNANNVAAGEGVLGISTNGTGVDGRGVIGVWGSSGHGGQAGVYGQHHSEAGPGVVGDGLGSAYAGVLGRNSGGTGVLGEGSNQAEVAGVRGLGKTGVWGSSAATGYSGLYGQHTGSSGYGVVGDGTGATGSGVLGRSPNGPGIEGRASKYGGKFAGSQAQLMLVPAGTAGKPSGAHTKGEISMDSAGTLFICVASSTATAAAKWRKVTTTAV
jgi:hypothetical protein